MYFETPVDHDVLYDNRLYNGKSGYQIDYCDIKADIRRRLLEIEDKEKSRLPEDLVIPLTSQKYDYRNPTDLAENALKRPPMIKAVNNLGQNEQINEILHVTTGDSEYNAKIGKLGDFIVVNQMHGKIDHSS
ncbi:hypothetical protein NQ314_005166 [Rhamnusium bicolor]|uniref:DNA-directed RNA polymerase n=1 Tax=Rhamnusium bicolor TaxID=1586634 RepID=A0AAV8ZKE7_9CUCU|nr:hypothetical protein NQ314_005166 [Rhamnusium bicolor]